MPDNRQLAVLIWLAVAVVLIMLNHDLRRSMRSVIRSLLARKVVIVFIMMSAWVTGEILLARQISWWDRSMTASTAFWFVGTGLVLLLNTSKAAADSHFFRQSFLSAIKLSVLLSVFMNLFVLTLPAELLLQPMLVALLAMSVVASHKDEFKQVKIVVDGLIGVAFIGFITYEVFVIANDWNTLSPNWFAQGFLLPVWLTLGVLPFIYLAGVYSEYDASFLRTEWATGPRWGRRMALVASFGLRSHKLHSFVASSAHALSYPSSFVDARRAIVAARDGGVMSEVDVQETASVLKRSRHSADLGR